jgi:hypothetical protein
MENKSQGRNEKSFRLFVLKQELPAPSFNRLAGRAVLCPPPVGRASARAGSSGASPHLAKKARKGLRSLPNTARTEQRALPKSDHQLISETPLPSVCTSDLLRA